MVTVTTRICALSGYWRSSVRSNCLAALNLAGGLSQALSADPQLVRERPANLRLLLDEVQEEEQRG
jgi:hypothetical protein